MDIVEEKITWLGEHDDADPEEFQQAKKDVEAVAGPIISQLYEQAGGAGAGAGEDFGGAGDDGEEHDEL